ANIGSANVSQYTIGTDGSLAPMAAATVAAGAKPQSVTADPSVLYVYVANRGSSTISQYTIGASGALTANAPPSVPGQSVPQSIAMARNMVPVTLVPLHAYVANESDNDVSQYAI